MLTSRVGVRVSLLLVLLFSPAAFAAQTNGTIIGQVLDAQGNIVPGVTVTVTSPALQGTRTQVADGQGEYRFSLLPPGKYVVQGKLTGFRPAEVQGVDVQLDRTATVTLTLQVGGVNETVVVSGTSSTIDTTSTTTGVNVNAELFNRIPMGRDFYAVARVAPGATEDTVGPVIYGSTGAENQYIIDGLNTTGIELGDKGKTLNFDFIQEVEVKTGGLSAEYGRMTGGVINVITKSGSNVFRGSLFGFIEGGGLQANENTRSKRPATTTQVVDVSSRGDAGGELGGYLKKDRLWFFGAFNHVKENRETTIIQTLSSPGSPALDSVVPASISRDLYAAKLTYKAGQAQTLTLTATGDPSTRDGNVFTIAGPESTWKGERKTGGIDVVGKYEAVIGAKMLISAMAARHKESDDTTGPGRSVAQLIDQTVTPNALSGGFGFFQDQKFTRDVLKAEVTQFLGTHSIKGGIDYEHIQAENNNYNGGAGQRIYRLSTGANGTGTIYYRHRFYINDKAPGFDRDDVNTWEISVPLTTSPDSQNVSFYAQDSWRAASRLTINAGIRWEGQNVRSRDRETAFKLNDNWAPRIGGIFDVQGNGRSKLYANWGRFYESVPMDINIRAFGGEIQCFCYNFSADSSNFAQDPLAPRRQSTLGGSTEAVDPDLTGQYIDEAIVGYEYDLGKSLVIGAKFTKRTLGNVIEDFLIPSEGEYFIANPGKGIGVEMGFYDFEHVAPAPKAERTSTAFEITGRKRFSNNWQFLASVVFSKLEGNYDGTFQVSTGQLDPNINSAFDYADFLVNSKGLLSNDRKVQVKFDGSYEFSTGKMKGLNVGVSTHWYSGTPLNAYGYSFAYANWEYYLAPRGSVGRGPSNYESDLQLTYPIAVGGTRRLHLQADIFNLFNRQAISQSDERYNLVEDGACGGIPDDLCNQDGGIVTTGDSLTPAGALANVRLSASNPDYLKKGLGFTGQRSIRLGVRFLF